MCGLGAIAPAFPPVFGPGVRVNKPTTKLQQQGRTGTAHSCQGMMLALLAGVAAAPVPDYVSLPIVDLSTANASTLLHAVDAHGFIVLVNHGLSGQRATSLLEDALQPGASTAGWRRSKAGYGPGLQYREHTEGENYSTAEGSYRNGGREDFVFYDPSVPMRKAAGDSFYTSSASSIWFEDVEQKCPDTATCEAFAHYYRGVQALSNRLLQMFGQVLVGRTDAFSFVAQEGHHTSNLVAGHQAASLEASKDGDGSERISAHADTGLLTLIQYGSAGPEGLEVRDRVTGNWLRVRSDTWQTDAILVNIGESLHRLSHGWLRSTPHRVIDRTPVGQRAASRTALIYFAAVGYDIIVSPQLDGPADEGADAMSFAPEMGGRLTHGYLTAPASKRAAFDEWAEAKLREHNHEA